MSATLQLHADERWISPSPIRRMSTTMALIAAASLTGHLLLVATAVVTGRPPPPAPPDEISVELVQDTPRPEAPKPEAAKGAPLKAATSVPATPDPVAPKVLPPKSVPPKPQAEPHSAAQPKAEPAKPTPPAGRTEQKPPPAPSRAEELKAQAEETKLASLQRELETLKAEQASLRAERSAQEAQAAAPALHDTGMGPLPDSFQAVALPAAADGAGEAVSYQEIVFSALAKAKGIGRTKGLPGSAGVRFSIDDRGRLLDVELVRKSGVAALDAEALDIVRRAAPFPAPPQGAQRSFSANVTFVTEGGP